MTRTSLAVLALAAAAMLAVHAWLAVALYDRVDDFIYKWTWIEALIYAAGAIVVLRDPSGSETGMRGALVLILVVAVILRVILLFAPPLSTDLYRYIWDGRVQAAGINPYRYVPANEALAYLRDDAIYPLINRKTYAPTIYPPVAQMVFFTITRIGESVWIMKAAMVGVEAVAAWAILRLLHRRGQPPIRILLYVWHPLPIWEFAGNGHVDALAIACLCLGLLAADARRPATVGMALASMLLTKFYPVVVAPALYRRWGWRLPVAFVATIVICYLPYLGVGAKVFGFLNGYTAEEGLRQGWGLYPWLLLKYLAPSVQDGWVKFYPVAVAFTLAALGVAVLLRRADRDLTIKSAFTLAILVTFLISPHYAWYFAWLVPFLVFFPSPAVIYLTTAAAFFEQVDWPDDFDLVSYIYLPFLILLLIEIAFRLLRARRRPHAEPVGIVAG
jgi:alpha-1,6-mannosyltransferase